MNRGCFLVLVMVAAIGIQPLFARPLYEESPTEESSSALESPRAQSPAAQSPDGTDPTAEAAAISRNIRDNPYLLESRRLATLAQETYQYGDYDLSASLAREAIHHAQLSDEYVTQQLRAVAIDQAIASAKNRLDLAASSGTSRQHPAEYSEAETRYQESLTARSGEDWDSAYESAQKAIDLLAFVPTPAGSPASPPASSPTSPPVRTASGAPLPATYTVRSWTTHGDCFWSIAARPWVYGDGNRWRVLYNANKSKLPDPNNPNLIEPGMVIEIPSIRGEIRQGAWSPNATYRPLN